ncbi:MAG: hypothetical protein L0Y42_10795 [Phycisphaerales bacterium]|nr:hypothetical protein [Phycisphaerales bacterium]
MRGDQAIEELFVLAADVGLENVELIIAPRDLRFKDRQGLPTAPAWIGNLYDEIQTALDKFPPLLSNSRATGLAD